MLQVSGNSKLVIDWAIDIAQFSNIVLEPILERILEIKALFEGVSFAHVFREFNHKAYQLSKECHFPGRRSSVCARGQDHIL